MSKKDFDAWWQAWTELQTMRMELEAYVQNYGNGTRKMPDFLQRTPSVPLIMKEQRTRKGNDL